MKRFLSIVLAMSLVVTSLPMRGLHASEQNITDEAQRHIGTKAQSKPDSQSVTPITHNSSSYDKASEDTSLITNKTIKPKRSVLSAMAGMQDPIVQAEAIFNELKHETRASGDNKEDINTLITRLTLLRPEIVSYKQRFEGSMAVYKKELEQNNASAEILSRHDAFMAKINDKFAEGYDKKVLAITTVIDELTSSQGSIRRIQSAIKRYNKQQGQGARVKGQEKQRRFPHRRGVRHTDKKHQHTGLRIATETQYAFAGKFGDIVTDAGLSSAAVDDPVTGDPIPQDIIETDAIQIIEEIETLARVTLHNDPKEIYEYIKNTIAYEPYYGIKKGSVETLHQAKGNDLDIASLLMALLRACDPPVPCRYVYQTIELTKDQVKSWTGLEDDASLVRYFQEGGIPVEEVNGKIQMDHVWVRMYLGFDPYRGKVKKTLTIDAAGEMWVDVDGSYKEHDTSPYRNIPALTSINPSVFLSELKQGAIVNTGDHSVTGISATGLVDKLTLYGAGIQQYAAANGLDINTMYRSMGIHADNYETLPASLPYSRVDNGAMFSCMPETVHHRVSITVNDGDWTELIRQSTTTASLAGKQILVHYTPDSATTAELNSNYINADTIGVAWCRVKPALMIGATQYSLGVDVPADYTIGLGFPQLICVEYREPFAAVEEIDMDTIDIRAGNCYALIFDLGAISASRQQTKISDLEDSLTRLQAGNAAKAIEQGIGGILDAAGINQLYQMDGLNKIIANSLNMLVCRDLSLVVAGV
jgi:hypothetical protein